MLHHEETIHDLFLGMGIFEETGSIPNFQNMWMKQIKGFSKPKPAHVQLPCCPPKPKVDDQNHQKSDFSRLCFPPNTSNADEQRG